jgi:hypothetical protein
MPWVKITKVAKLVRISADLERLGFDWHCRGARVGSSTGKIFLAFIAR